MKSEDTAEETNPDDPHFGESTLDGPRASVSFYVRRPLNDYTELEEVFEFYVTEPYYDQAERSGVPGVRYYITMEARTGRPGVDNEKFKDGVMPIHKIPDEVKYRAKRILDFVEFPPNGEQDE